MLGWVEADPVIPIHFGAKKKGMQSGEEIEPEKKEKAKNHWLQAFSVVVAAARNMNDLGLHKQVPNRMVEPWFYINVVLSATDFDNFFALRIHRDAQPEMQKLAVMMARSYRDSQPTVLTEGGWHLPYVSLDEKHLYPPHLQQKMSTARCCRVSYLTLEGKPPDVEKDIALHDQLIADKHFSPTEHLAEAHSDPDFRSGNFRGWKQYRQTLTDQCIQKFDYSILDQFEKDYMIS